MDRNGAELYCIARTIHEIGRNTAVQRSLGTIDHELPYLLMVEVHASVEGSTFT